MRDLSGLVVSDCSATYGPRAPDALPCSVLISLRSDIEGRGSGPNIGGEHEPERIILLFRPFGIDHGRGDFDVAARTASGVTSAKGVERPGRRGRVVLHVAVRNCL